MVEGTDAKPYFATTNRQDVPRLDYRNADGTLSSCPRLLLEPQRTNSIRNSTMVGAVAGSPGTLPTNWGNVGASGGLSRDVVGVGISNGLPYVDLRYYGTASSAVIIMAPDSFFSNTTSAGQVWTTSFWLSYIGSGRPNRTDIAIDWRGGSPAVIISTISPTSSLARFSFSGTATTGTTTAMGYVQFILTIGATYDFTIRIAAPQMELGAYATTFIPTTTAAVTRLVDAFSRNNLFTNNIVTASGGTWFLDLSGNLSIPRDTSTGIFIGDSATNNTGNQIIIRNGSSSGSARVSILKYISGTVTSIYTTTSDNLKLAIKWNGSVVEVFQNGVKVVSSSVFTTTNMQNLVGNGGGTPFFINQSSLFPTPLTDEECITITTL
jgi:hypothetical protein